MSWTLEYDAVEKTFEDWGFTQPKMFPRKLSVTTFTVRVPGIANLVAAPPIPFKGQVIIRRGQAAALVGDEVVFSGGEIVFQGRQITDKRMAARTPAQTLTFGDAWWDLENLVFQQQWKFWDSGSQTGLSQPFCDLNLFQAFASGVSITNGAQAAEIIAWAAAAGVNIQAGTIDLGWYLQPYPASALSCASALQICLKPTPGACCWIDMSTTPPSFNCRERSFHAALTLPYGSGNHQSSDLEPRYDMQVPQVVIQYRKSVRVTIGEQSYSWLVPYLDAWPLDATLPAEVRGGKQVGALVVKIDLANFQRTDLVQKVSAAAFGNPPDLDWWKGKKATMRDYTDLAYVAGSLKILDASGTDITSTVLADYPNELVDGQVTGWMKDENGDAIGVQAVTVQGSFTYSQKDAQGRTWHTVGAANPHVVSVNVRLTNSAAGEQTYSVTQSLDTGQLPVSGLAQNIWTLLSTLFVDGTHTMVEGDGAGAAQVGTIVDCRYAINLSGGAALWETMLSPVHGADIDFMRGKTEVRFGLPKHVGPADLEQMCQYYKFRRIFTNTMLRATGNLAADAAQTGGDGARENTSDSKAPPALHLVTAPALDGGNGSPVGLTQLGHDATGQQTVMRVVDAAGGAVAGQPIVTIRLQDTKGSDNNYHPIAFRELCVFNEDGSVAGTIMALCSEVY